MPRTSILNDDETVIAAVTKSSSMLECLQLLGLRAAGGNYKGLHAACARIGIPSPICDPLDQTLASRKMTTIPLEDILVENSTYANRTRLKIRLVAAGLLEYRCNGSNCTIVDSWNGAPLTLHLEHKNGVWNDNRIENLEFLCPNCHSQTTTYAGRNR